MATNESVRIDDLDAVSFIHEEVQALVGICPSESAPQPREVLEFVSNRDYGPSASQHDALELLAGRYQARQVVEGECLPGFQRALETSLADQIEQFASQYWQISPAQRERDWCRLYGRAALSRSQRRRLEMLQAGLTVPLPQGLPESQAFAPQIFEMLARYIRSPQRARKQILMELIALHKSSPKLVRRSARRVLKANRRLAGLAPEFVRVVYSLRARWLSWDSVQVWLGRLLRWLDTNWKIWLTVLVVLRVITMLPEALRMGNALQQENARPADPPFRGVEAPSPTQPRQEPVPASPELPREDEAETAGTP
ncbi:MAG: hypothetical protein JSS02_05100 [Planctomycetes bacterium]|nr:hypothetical protein [Planctomycetota bacterium]